MTATLIDRFAQAFVHYRDRVFLQTPEGLRWTYGDADREIEALTAQLQRLGLNPGDRLLVQTEKSPQALFLYFACARAGGIYLPLNTDYTPSELTYFIGDAEPKIIVCRSAALSLFKGIAEGMAAAPVLLTLDREGSGSFAAASPDQRASAIHRAPNDVAAILYTSGTTGKPKGAMLTHANLCANAQTLVQLWRFSPADTLLHILPIFHVHGLFVAVHCAVFSGAGLLFMTKFEPAQVIAHMARASVLMGVPTHYTRLLSEPTLTRAAAQTMRLFIAGSAPLSADTFRAFEERTGHCVLERYGMTETGMLTSNPYDGPRVPGSVGKPLPDVALRIADAQSGQPLATGEVGIVEVRGPNVFAGYWRNPEKTATEFKPDGFFITGDMGFIDSQGYVHLVGRAKDLIITGGLNVYPKEIEALLDERPEIAESAVIGIPHPDFGEAVIAVIKPSTASLDLAIIRSALRESLAPFKVPKEILVMDDLPRNTMGKVQKNLLREQFRDLFKAR